MSKLSAWIGACLAFGLVPVSLAAESAPEPKAREEQVICKREDASTGSRMGARKVCRTKAEWDAQSRQNREQVDEITRRGLVQDEANPGG